MNPLSNPWVIVAALLALAAAAAGGARVGWDLRDADAQRDKVAWEQTRKVEAQQAAAALDKAHREARAAEQTAATQAAIDAADYQKEIEDAKDQGRRDVAAARAGRIILRVPGACPVRADGGGSPAPAASGPGDHGAADAELPGSVAADLLELADDADAITRQLAAAQRRIQFDLAHCGQAVKPAP